MIFSPGMQLQQVDDRRSARRPARLRNLIALQPVHSSLVCKEHQVMVCARHKQLLDVVIIDRLHPLDALAAAVLAPEIIRRHALDISKMCHRDDDILIRDQILGRDVKDIAAR